ncbi:MAG: AEC family transporter [Thiolinea sp.]
MGASFNFFGLVVEILNVLAPAAILATIGVIWAKKGPEFPVKFVTTLVLNIGMPALLFSTLASSSVELGSLGDMVLATLLVHLIFSLLAIALLKQAGKDWRLCVALVVGNTGNLGLPVCFFAYGDEGLAYAMVFFSVQCLLLFSLADTVLAGNLSIKPVLRSPILHAVWLGTLAQYLDLASVLPKFVMDTSSLLGQLVVPVMLITLGVSLAGMSVKNLPETLKWSLIRTGIALLVGFGVATLVGLEGVARGILMIETTVPVAVFNFLLAIRHNRDSAEVSGLILATHLGAIIYLPILLGVLLV